MEFLWISALLALIGLDHKHAFQLAISQPLIICSLVGALTGSFMTAMYFGMIIQMIWLGNLPVGASTTPDGNLASASGCLLYVTYLEPYAAYGQLILLLVFVYVVFISYVGGFLEIKIRKVNVRIFDNALIAVRQPEKINLGKYITTALVFQFLYQWFFILITYWIGSLLFNVLSVLIPNNVSGLWAYIDLAILGAGIGMVISVYKSIRLRKILAFVTIIGLFLFKII